MARRCKLTPEVQERICHAIRIGAYHEHAALAAGVSYETFRRWMAQGERASSGQFRVFCVAVKKAEAAAAVGWLARIEQAANDGQWQAAAWKLERRFPDKWGRNDRVAVQHEGAVDVRVIADMHAAIVGAVQDIPTRVRIAEALMALDAPDEDGGDDGIESES